MKLKYNDKVHGYWLDGKRCRGVSTCAKIPDDTFALDQWRKRQVAIGLAMKPSLLESVAAHHNDRSKLDLLCEEAMTAAGASDAAEAGTAAHRVTERMDSDEEIIWTPAARRTANQWKAVLEHGGIDIVTDLVERVVVYPEWRLCGKFDRVGRRRSDGRLVAIDLKTGESAVRYPHAVATQLALYANAPLLAGEWDGLDGETEHFEPLPADLDREVGYMIHLPADDDASIYAVNLKLGWKCVQEVIFPTLAWRDTPVGKIIKKF